MKIIEFQNEEFIKKALKDCSWGAGKFLYDLIIKDQRSILGWNYIYALVENNSVLSFCTLAQKDCIKDDMLVPWIGFVFTMPEYRGKGYAKKLIMHCLKQAKELGYKKVYLATDHIGLYERYGFQYLESRIDIYDEESRIYYYDLEE